MTSATSATTARRARSAKLIVIACACSPSIALWMRGRAGGLLDAVSDHVLDEAALIVTNERPR